MMRIAVTITASLLIAGFELSCTNEPAPTGSDTSSGGNDGQLGGGGPTGGTAPSSGGTAPSSGGTAPSDGGTASSDGGTASSDGSGGSDVTGGSGGAGGTQTTGGSDSGGSGGSDVTGGTGGAGGISIDGRRLLVGGAPIELRGVCWNPVPKGQTHPDGLDFAGLGPTDIPLMAAAGINVVRTYEPIRDRGVLDRLHAAGIHVLMTVYAWGGAEPNAAVSTVEQLKDHPAILLWQVGNEWNYNGLYVEMSFADSLARVAEVAALVKAADPTRPVATVYGEVPTTEVLEQLAVIDVWGINAYRGISFGDLFSRWSERSQKPMYLAEYGADAYDSRIPGPNPEAQATATLALTHEILAASAATGGTCLGGTLFEWADEWWKAGNVDVQDAGGVAPGGGPYPDSTFNEEWWGIVDIDRIPRPAYTALQELWTAR